MKRSTWDPDQFEIYERIILESMLMRSTQDLYERINLGSMWIKKKRINLGSMWIKKKDQLEIHKERDPPRIYERNILDPCK
jgi:hypothetical protein